MDQKTDLTTKANIITQLFIIFQDPSRKLIVIPEGEIMMIQQWLKFLKIDYINLYEINYGPSLQRSNKLLVITDSEYMRNTNELFYLYNQYSRIYISLKTMTIVDRVKLWIPGIPPTALFEINDVLGMMWRFDVEYIIKSILETQLFPEVLTYYPRILEFIHYIYDRTKSVPCNSRDDFIQAQGFIALDNYKLIL